MKDNSLLKKDEDIYTTVNNLKYYFYDMIKINNDLIKLLFFKGYSNFEKADLFLEICGLIFKIIPIRLKCNNIVIDQESGILLIGELKDTVLPYLENIGKNYDSILYKIKKLRNKTEHQPHNIKIKFMLTENNTYRGFCFFAFKYNDEDLSVSSQDLINIINVLNECFSKIQIYLRNYSQNNILKQDYYYNSLINEHFCKIDIKGKK